MPILDTLTEVGANGSATSLSAPGKAVGATSINVGSTVNWPASGKTVFFAIRTVNPSAITTANPSGLVAGTYSEWKGIVGSNTITSMVIQPGSIDQIYTAGTNTQVLIPVTASRENALVAWGQVSHDNIGNLLAGIVSTNALAANAVTNAKLGNASVNYASLLSTIFSSQIQIYTNPGTGGGTFNYINLGGIKLFYGRSAQYSIAANSQISLSITYPVGFFTVAPTYISNSLTALISVAQQSVFTQLAPTITTDVFSILNSAGSAGGGFVDHIAIGT